MTRKSWFAVKQNKQTNKQTIIISALGNVPKMTRKKKNKETEISEDESRPSKPLHS